MPVQKQPFGTWCLVQFFKSRVEVFVNCSAFGSLLLCQYFFVRENLRRLRENFETQNPNLGPLCRVPIKSEMMAKWGDGDLLSFLEHNGAKVVLKLYEHFNTIGNSGLAPWMSFWVSSALDCSLYRWRLFVYFTFPST